MQIVFATGIHGVGKTTLCSVLSNELQIPLFTASTLIREARGDLRHPDILNSEIQENARYFKLAVQKLVREHQRLLIDGHTVLLTDAGRPCRIARCVFEKLPIACFLILFEDVDVIRSRLKTRSTLNLPESSLIEFQNEELLYALELAGDMGCDVVVARSSEDPQTISERLLRTRMLACSNLKGPN